MITKERLDLIKSEIESTELELNLAFKAMAETIKARTEKPYVIFGDFTDEEDEDEEDRDELNGFGIPNDLMYFQNDSASVRSNFSENDDSCIGVNDKGELVVEEYRDGGDYLMDFSVLPIENKFDVVSKLVEYL